MTPSHGSISKAGKTRDKMGNQRTWREETKYSRKQHATITKLRRNRKHNCPRVSKRKNYNKLLRQMQEHVASEIGI